MSDYVETLSLCSSHSSSDTPVTMRWVFDVTFTCRSLGELSIGVEWQWDVRVSVAVRAARRACYVRGRGASTCAFRARHLGLRVPRCLFIPSCPDQSSATASPQSITFEQQWLSEFRSSPQLAANCRWLTWNEKLKWLCTHLGWLLSIPWTLFISFIYCSLYPSKPRQAQSCYRYCWIHFFKLWLAENHSFKSIFYFVRSIFKINFL